MVPTTAASDWSTPSPHQLVTPQSLSTSSVTKTPSASREGARCKSLGRGAERSTSHPPSSFCLLPQGWLWAGEMNVTPTENSEIFWLCQGKWICSSGRRTQSTFCLCACSPLLVLLRPSSLQTARQSTSTPLSVKDGLEGFSSSGWTTRSLLPAAQLVLHSYFPHAPPPTSHWQDQLSPRSPSPALHRHPPPRLPHGQYPS